MKSKGISLGIVSLHPFDGSPGSILRIRELTRSLSSFGVKITYFSPYLPNESWGSNVTSCRLPTTGSSIGIEGTMYNLARRALNNHVLIKPLISRTIINRMIDSLAKSIITKVDKELIDFLQGEQDIAALACIRAKKKLCLPIVSSLHNIWSEELLAMKLIKYESPQHNFLKELEKEIVTGSDLIIVVSEEMKRYLRDKYTLDCGRIAVIPPGGRLKKTHVQEKTNFKVVYSGLVAQRGNLELFIRSMPLILKEIPNVQFYITKKGEELNKIRKLANKVGVKPKFYWFDNNKKFYDFLASCHLGVVTSSDDLPRRIGPAVKLFDYLSAGLPVVANDIGGWTNIIRREQVGLLTKSDPESFARGIVRLLNNQDLSAEFGKNALQLVSTKLNWDKSGHLLVKEYAKLLYQQNSALNISNDIPLVNQRLFINEGSKEMS